MHSVELKKARAPLKKIKFGRFYSIIAVSDLK
jgi:hypothetical protein